MEKSERLRRNENMTSSFGIIGLIGTVVILSCCAAPISAQNVSSTMQAGSPTTVQGGSTTTTTQPGASTPQGATSMQGGLWTTMGWGAAGGKAPFSGILIIPIIVFIVLVAIMIFCVKNTKGFPIKYMK